MRRQLLLVIVVSEAAAAFLAGKPSSAAKSHSKAMATIDEVGQWLSSPEVRFEAVAFLVASALASKVTQSPLRRRRKEWTKPLNMSRAEWRTGDVAKWRLSRGETPETVAIFLREWASTQQELRSASVEAIESGVRIRWAPRQKYLSANEERRLESLFEQRAAKVDTSLIPIANSIYRYPRKKTRTAVGGVDVLVDGTSVVSVSRCAYANNEPIKEASERRLVAILDRDLQAAYGATLLSRGSSPALENTNQQSRS